VQAHPEVLTPRTAYALLTMGSLTILTPLALLMEWSGAGSSRLAAASTSVGALRTGWRARKRKAARARRMWPARWSNGYGAHSSEMPLAVLSVNSGASARKGSTKSGNSNPSSSAKASSSSLDPWRCVIGLMIGS